MRDLVVLTADRNAQSALCALLKRPHTFESCNFSVEVKDILRHARRDPGVLGEAADFLRSYSRSHRFALVCFDHEGCGKDESVAAEYLEAQVESDLQRNGWSNGRCAAVVFEPELERWLWNGSSALGQFLQLETYSQLRRVLEQQGFVFDASGKPERPKEAFESALRVSRIPRSSSCYVHLAAKLSATRCQERGFLKLKATLQRWFPQK